MYLEPMMKRNAFTLVEILIVVIMLGILASLVIPKFASAQGDAVVAATAEDLRRMEVAIGRYQAKNGIFPVDVNPKLTPAGLDEFFRENNPFAKPAPIGGNYDYEGTPHWSPIQISIRADGTNSHTDADALALDVYMDDGSLNSGSLRRSGGRTYFIISAD